MQVYKNNGRKQENVFTFDQMKEEKMHHMKSFLVYDNHCWRTTCLYYTYIQWVNDSFSSWLRCWVLAYSLNSNPDKNTARFRKQWLNSFNEPQDINVVLIFRFFLLFLNEAKTTFVSTWQKLFWLFFLFLVHIFFILSFFRKFCSSFAFLFLASVFLWIFF